MLADQFAAEAKKLFDSGEFNQAGELYIKAFDKDPLQYSHSLNAALTFYNLKDFENALKYFNLSKSSKDPKVYEKSLRFNALTLFSIGDNVGACADFIKLFNRFPKRMYQQEFNKYCRSK